MHAQGAAFDVTQEVADAMMANAQELTMRGFTIDLPTSLPAEPIRSFGGGGGRCAHGSSPIAAHCSTLRSPMLPQRVLSCGCCCAHASLRFAWV